MTSEPVEPLSPLARPQKLLPWLLLALGAVVYANAVGAGFIFDDRPHIIRNPALHSLWPLTNHLLGKRGLVQFSLALNYAIEGREPRGYHLVNVVIHLLSALALYGLVWRTLLTGRLRATFQHSACWLAAIIAAIWMVHPLQTQAVTYIIQRAEAMAGLFFFLMLYCTVRQHESVGRGARMGWTAAALVSYLASVLSKETLAVVPLVVLLYDRCFLAGTFRAALRQRAWLYGVLALWIGMATVLVFRSLALESSAGFNVANSTPMTYLFTQPAVIAQYLQLVFWPHPLVLDYLWKPAMDVSEHVPQTVLIVTLGVLTLWALWHNRPIGVMGAWFFIALAPTSSFVPILDLYMEHRMYVPLAALVAVLVIGGDALLRRGGPGARRLWLGGGAAGLAVLALGAVTIDRNFDYYNELTIWKTVIDARPKNARAQINYGAALYDVAKRPWDALHHYRLASKLAPSFPDSYINIGSVFLNMGRLEEAEGAYLQAYKMDPRNGAVLRNLGKLKQRRGDLAEAERFIREAINAEPQYGPNYDDLGVVLMQQGRLSDAETALRTATSLMPEHVYGWINLAELHLKQGMKLEAAQAAKRALALPTIELDLATQAGSLLARAGALDDAVAVFRQLIAANPQAAALHSNLAGALLMQGRAAEALAAYRAALECNPNDHVLVRRVAWLLATLPDDSLRNPVEALQMANWANQQSGGKTPIYLQTLGAALANAGRFEEAVKVQEAALVAAQAAAGARPEVIEEYRRQLESYRQGRPWRQAVVP